MIEQNTPFGSITQNAAAIVTIAGTHNELYDWANRSGSSWPCSALADYDNVIATFCENGDLIELSVTQNGRDDEADDLTADELNAWTDDVRASAINA